MLPTIRRFSLNLLVRLINADGIHRQWFWQRRWGLALLLRPHRRLTIDNALRSHEGPKMTRVGNASSEPVVPAMALAFTASMESRTVD